MCCNGAVAQYYDNVTFTSGIVHQYNNGFLGGGVSMCDFDGDGLDDISICQRNVNPLFFRNTGGAFEQVPYVISNDKEMKQITWVDYDNDGDKDLFTTSLLAPFKLYRNDGNFDFTDISLAAGFPATTDYTFGNCWADYDLDGDLDVFISNYNGIGFGNPLASDLLFRNNGDDTFTNVTVEAGFGSEHCYTFMSIWMDLNGDLWPDLYNINDRYECQDYLYLNNGDGTFTDVTVSSGVVQNILSMNISAEDYDNDGDFDIYVSNGTEGCSFFRHDENDVFTEIADINGTVLNVFCWGTQFVDADNDMWQDMFVSSTPHQATTGQDRFLLNNQDGTFSNITNESGFIAETSWNRSVATGDYNQDGFPDLFTAATLPSYSSLWRAVPNDNNWLKVQLQGVVSNRDGISSRIECYVNGICQSRYTYCGEAYLAQNSSSEIFGMDQYEKADSLIVKWPSGIIDKWYNIPAGQHLYLVEGTSSEVIVQYTPFFCDGDSAQIQANQWSAYAWSNGENSASMFIHEPQNLVLTVSDQYGNQFQSDTISLDHFPAGEFEWSTHNPSCFGESNGWISIENADWLPAFIWLNDSLYPGSSVYNLTPDLYEISFQDEHGCIQNASFELTNPEELTAQAWLTQPLCYDETGQAVIEVAGAQGGYVVNLGSADLGALEVGAYELVISDAMNCETTLSFEIVGPMQINADITTTHVWCAGEQSGAMVIENVSGGTGVITANPEYQGLPLFAGEYNMMLIDEVGCSREFMFTIEEPEPLALEVITTPEYEMGESGSAEVIVTGGVAPYTYIWSELSLTDSLAQNLTQGNYAITVEDQHGCFSYEQFTIDFVAEMSELHTSDYTLFPNPAMDKLFLIQPSNAGTVYYSLFDVSGKLIIKDKCLNPHEGVDISSFSQGSYYIQIKTNGREISLPFAIIK